MPMHEEEESIVLMDGQNEKAHTPSVPTLVGLSDLNSRNTVALRFKQAIGPT
jgi:hypothetical protein